MSFLLKNGLKKAYFSGKKWWHTISHPTMQFFTPYNSNPLESVLELM